MNQFEESLFLLRQSRKNFDSLWRDVSNHLKNLKFVRKDGYAFPSGNLIVRYKADREMSDDVHDDIRHKALTIIKDARCVIDHAVYAGIEVLTGRPPEKNYFPFSSGPKDLKGKVEKDFPQPLWDALKSFQSYPPNEGGNKVLWDLNETSNTNKHRFNFKVVGNITNYSANKIAGSGAVRMSIPPEWDWKKGEIVIAEIKPGHPIHYDFKFKPGFIFDHAGPISGCSVKRVLTAFMDQAGHVTDTLKSETMKAVATA